MTKLRLSLAAVRASELRLAEKISPTDRSRLQQLIPLIDGQGNMNLGSVLQTLFPDKPKEAAQTAFRQFRARLTAGAEDAKLAFALESDGRTRGEAGEQSCYFTGDDTSQAAAIEFSEAETAPLRRDTTIDQGYMEMREGKPLVRCYISFSDNDRKEMERLLGKIASRLRNSPSFTYELFDRSQLLAGDQRDQALLSQLENSDLILVLLSQDWLGAIGVPDVERLAVLGRDGVAPLPYFPVALLRLPTDATWTNWHGIDPATVMRDLNRAAFANCRQDDAFADLLVQQIQARVVRDIYPSVDLAVLPLRSRKAEHHARCHLSEQREHLRRYTENAAFLGEIDTFGKDTMQAAGGATKAPERRLVVHDLMEWLTADSGSPYCALLGETGMGKTTACLALVQALLQGRERDASLRIPIYLDLRKLRSRLTPGRNQEAALPRTLSLKEMLDTIIAGTVQSLDSPLTADDVIRLAREDGALVIFDGLDEVLVHLSAADGQAFTRELFRILPPALLAEEGVSKGRRLGRLLMTCRTQYFRTLNDQAKHFLAEGRDGIVRRDYRALVLLPFDEKQIRHYLQLALPSEDPDRILDLFRSVHNLSELAERPYTLSLLTDRIAEIESWKMAGRKVTGVTVYGAFTAAWLKRDDPKHTFAPAHKALLMEYLAAELWRRGRKTWSVDDLEQWLVDFLADHPELTRHYGAAADGGLNDRHLIELFKEDLRTATFLAREGEAAFRFAHTSLQEYFLAGHLHRALVENRPAAWALPKVNRETLDFLGQLALESSEEGAGEQVLATLRSLRDASPTGAAELAFAYFLHAVAQAYPTPSPAGFQLAGADLGHWEIAGAPGKPLPLGRTDFSGARLDGTVFRQVNLDGANFSRANLTKAEFLSCRGVGASFAEAVLPGTIFRECNLAKADYSGAESHRSQWLFCRLEEARGFPSTSPSGLVAPAAAGSVSPMSSLRLGRFVGHSSAINDCVYSPDGERLLSASGDQTLRLWDAKSGECLLTLAGHESGVNGCAFSPDGERLLSASDDQTLRLWDSQSGDCLLNLVGHEIGVNGCAFSPDGKRLLSAGADWTLRLWDAQNGDCLLTRAAHQGRVLGCAFSPGGERLLSVGDDRTLRLWDTRTGNCLLTLAGYRVGARVCAFSPDGERLLSASQDGTLRLWGAQSGDCLLTLTGHKGEVWSCSFSPDGERLLSASQDGTLRLWDTRSGNCLLSLSGHRGGVWGCAFLPDGERLLSVGGDRMQRLWDALSGECLQILDRYQGWFKGCAFSPDGERLLSASDEDEMLSLWSTRSRDKPELLPGHRGYAIGFAFSQDGKRLLSASEDRTLRLWDAQNGRCLLILEGHQGEVMGCAFSPDGDRLLSASGDRTLRLWDAHSGNCLLTLTGHESGVSGCAFSPDGERLLSASTDGTLRLWDSRTGQPLGPLIQQFDDQAWAVIDLPNNRIVQVCGDAWRWLGWQGVDPGSGCMERYPAECFGPLRTYLPVSEKVVGGDRK